MLLLAVVPELAACRSGERDGNGAKGVEPRVVASASEAPKASREQLIAPAVSSSSGGAADWDPVTLEDEAPLCVFSDYGQQGEVRFPTDVRKQSLRADSRVVFGIFPLGCLNEACDTPPTLACSVEREEPSTLVVHSRLSYQHKRGSICTGDCRPVMAGCETEVLEAGKYTVKYGGRTFSLRIPSVATTPCFKLE